MARLRVYKENNADCTLLSNRFIDEYMGEANDAQLKVYLYLTRMMAANQATSVSDMADLFNHTEKDIMRALKYWEKKSLLELDYDEYGNLSGIHLIDLSAKTGRNNISDIPITSIMPKEPVTPVIAPMEHPLTGITHADKQEKSEVVAEAPVFTKPYYSLDQLKAAKEDERTKQLLFVAQTYIGKPLSPTEIKTIMFFMDTLQFSDDMIDYLLQYCIERGKKDFKYIEKVAVNWAESGITTPEEAQKNVGKYDRNVYAIMNELGKSNTPTPAELQYITRWVNEYGFSNEIIFEACKRTVLTTDKNRFEYAEGILSNWYKEHVGQLSDIKKMDELHQRKRSSRTSGTNKFSQFTQTTYDFAELEKKLLSN